MPRVFERADHSLHDESRNERDPERGSQRMIAVNADREDALDDCDDQRDERYGAKQTVLRRDAQEGVVRVGDELHLPLRRLEINGGNVFPYAFAKDRVFEKSLKRLRPRQKPLRRVDANSAEVKKVR